MDRSCSDYSNIIDEVENIEQVIITENKCKKVCYFALEILKLGIQYIKKNANINTNGKKEKRIKDKEGPMPDIEARKKTAESVNYKT